MAMDHAVATFDAVTLSLLLIGINGVISTVALLLVAFAPTAKQGRLEHELAF